MNFLFLRGLTRDGRHWWKFPDEFKAQCPEARVFSLDFPGVGTEHKRISPLTIPEIRADVQRQMHSKIASGEWPKGQWNLFAISLGGMVALDWIANEPGLFSKAVIGNSSSGSHSTFFERVQISNLPKIIQAIGIFKPEISEKIILELTANLQGSNPDYLKDAVRWRYEAPLTRRTFFAQTHAMVKYKLPTDIKIPVLVIGSEKDRLVSVECSKKIAKALAAPIIFHPTAGHDLSLDDPKWLSQELKKFFCSSN